MPTVPQLLPLKREFSLQHDQCLLFLTEISPDKRSREPTTIEAMIKPCDDTNYCCLESHASFHWKASLRIASLSFPKKLCERNTLVPLTTGIQNFHNLLHDLIRKLQSAQTEMFLFKKIGSRDCRIAIRVVFQQRNSGLCRRRNRSLRCVLASLGQRSSIRARAGGKMGSSKSGTGSRSHFRVWSEIKKVVNFNNVS